MNAGENLFRPAIRCNHADPIRFALGKLEEALTDPPVKLRRFIIETVG